MIVPRNTLIVVWSCGMKEGSFVASSFTPMSTTGKRYMDRTHDRSARKVLDARTKAVLNEVLTEPRGRALEAYLRSRVAKQA